MKIGSRCGRKMEQMWVGREFGKQNPFVLFGLFFRRYDFVRPAYSLRTRFKMNFGIDGPGDKELWWRFIILKIFS